MRTNYSSMSYEAGLNAYDSYLSKVDEYNEACEPIEDDIKARRDEIRKLEIELECEEHSEAECAEIEELIETIKDEIKDLAREAEELWECYR